MIDREKVIKGLECCMSDGAECYEPSNGKCPYYKDDVAASACTDDLFYDVYNLLKAQEPRVMTLEEVRKAEIAWIEQVGTVVPAMKVATSKKETMLFAYTQDGGVFYVNIELDHYGKITRCWTSCPTNEQMEATPWIAQE